MSQSPDVAQGKSAEVPRAQLWPLFVTVFLTGLCICLFDLVDGRLFLGDIDDQMREIQIRHLLFGGAGWWDLSLPFITLPEPYISPWSRLVDAPYVLITQLLAAFVGKEFALSLAFHLWPPIMLVVFCLQCAAIYRRIGVPASLFGYLIIIASTMLMVLALWEFAPGRIDHHNLQIIALMAILCGLARWDRAGGWLVGLGTVIAVAISLEGLPFIAAVYAALVLALFCRIDGAALMLKHSAAVMFWLTLPLAYGLLGPVGMLSTQCDAFSAPYIVLLTGFSAILWVAVRFLPEAGWIRQGAVIAVPALGLLYAFALLFPQCLAGPYWMIDPVSQTYWLHRVAQEHSALHFIEEGQLAMVALIAVIGCILTYASVVIARQRQEGWFGLLVILIVAWLAFILTLLLNRYIRFVFAFAPLFVPAALQVVVGTASVSAILRRVASAMIVVYFGVAVWLVMATPIRTPVYDAADYMTYETCEQGDLRMLSDNSPGRIAAPQGMGLRLLKALPPGFSLAAIPFHRASPGMKQIFEAFLSEDPAVRKNALSGFDYVAACRFPIKPDYGTAPLYDTLSAGKDWPGLIRLPTGADNPFQLFRIDHAALQ